MTMKRHGWLPLAALTVVVALAGCIGGAAAKKKQQSNNAEISRINTQLGMDYLRKGDFELAREKLIKAVDHDSGNAEAHGALGLLYANTGELAKARKHYQKSLDVRPDDPNVLNNYGVMLCGQGEYEKADLQFRRAAQSTRYSTPEVALANAGICARKLPDDAKAEAYLREAIKLNPNFADALGSMALLYADQSRYLNARAFLQRYESLQAPMTREMLLLGLRIELALGNRETAQRYAQALRAEHSENLNDAPGEDEGRAAGEIRPR